MNKLTTAAKEYHELCAQLASFLDGAKREEERLREEIRLRNEVLKLSEAGVDFEKVALAETVLYATSYKHGGNDRASCVADAIKQLSTGTPVRQFYGDLWRVYFGTKNYDRWSGQREDHEYGCGPRHGSTCFQIGLTSETRARDPKTLTPEETEAAIYYLLNLERVQLAQEAAKT
jgi:hypothetical protein